MKHSIETSQGSIAYTLYRKKVKNLNLRIHPNGDVSVSAPMRMPQQEINTFLQSKESWIRKHKTACIAKPEIQPCQYTKEECLALFLPVSDAIFLLFSEILQGEKPTLRVREMKTRWGVCYPQKKIITLNMRLAEKPRAALEYVVLHEYVHFIHPNHQAGFHAEMARLLPDYKERRKLLLG